MTLLAAVVSVDAFGGYGPHVIHPWTVRAVRYATTDPTAELRA
jgi:hypothetical protein